MHNRIDAHHVPRFFTPEKARELADKLTKDDPDWSYHVELGGTTARIAVVDERGDFVEYL